MFPNAFHHATPLWREPLRQPPRLPSTFWTHCGQPLFLKHELDCLTLQLQPLEAQQMESSRWVRTGPGLPQGHRGQDKGHGGQEGPAPKSCGQVRGCVIMGHCGRLREGTAALSSPDALRFCSSLTEKFYPPGLQMMKRRHRDDRDPKSQSCTAETGLKPKQPGARVCGPDVNVTPPPRGRQLGAEAGRVTGTSGVQAQGQGSGQALRSPCYVSEARLGQEPGGIHWVPKRYLQGMDGQVENKGRTLSGPTARPLPCSTENCSHKFWRKRDGERWRNYEGGARRAHEPHRGLVVSTAKPMPVVRRPPVFQSFFFFFLTLQSRL